MVKFYESVQTKDIRTTNLVYPLEVVADVDVDRPGRGSAHLVAVGDQAHQVVTAVDIVS